MNNLEAEMILEDQSKTIVSDLNWTLDGVWMKFRAEIANDSGAPLQIVGAYNFTHLGRLHEPLPIQELLG